MLHVWMCLARSFYHQATEAGVPLKELRIRGLHKGIIDSIQHLDGHDAHISQGTYICLLHDCIRFNALEEGKHIHKIIRARYPESLLGIGLGNALITLYVRFLAMKDAALVFEAMHERNAFTWTLMIRGYTNLGHEEDAFLLFGRMVSEGEERPDQFTFLAIFKACTSLDQGKQIHKCMVRFDLESNRFLRSALIDIYCRCGNANLAREVFDKEPDYDVVTWNSMISGYVELEDSTRALELFLQLQQEGMEANVITYLSVLKVCTVSEDLKQGKYIHCHVIELKHRLSVSVDNALINMYARCSSLANAEIVFSKINQPNVISWTVIVDALIENGYYEKALQYFWKMEKVKMKPDGVAFASAMKACANLANLAAAERLHACMIGHGVKVQASLENILIDMFVKCGDLHSAHKIFKSMHELDLLSGSVMVSGFALHGNAMKCFELIESMLNVGVYTDHIMSVSLLSACRHAGWVDEGLHCFGKMTQCLGLLPTSEHYGCIIDMLTRAGRVEQAFTLLHQIDLPWTVEVWTSVLGASEIFWDLNMANHAARELLDVKPHSTTPFVMMSNIYARACRWETQSESQKVNQIRWVS